MVETRRLVAQFETPEALRDAMMRFIAENSAEAYVLYRELDYFEQLGALEKHGGFDFELIKTLLGRRLTDRWENVAAVDRCNRRKCHLPDVRKARDKDACPAVTSQRWTQLTFGRPVCRALQTRLPFFSRLTSVCRSLDISITGRFALGSEPVHRMVAP